jgi:hypothetical protein
VADKIPVDTHVTGKKHDPRPAVHRDAKRAYTTAGIGGESGAKIKNNRTAGNGIHVAGTRGAVTGRESLYYLSLLLRPASLTPSPAWFKRGRVE